MSQPIVIYNHATGPNPKKVVIILEELGIPYTLTDVTKPKEEAFLKINPNGRMPAIQDPNNNNFVLWESGAICKYIVETYDKENKLNITTLPEKWYLEQWLQFQMSGQGPYYGQGVWFHKFHAEDVPSAKKRYLEQIERVWGVLDNVLKDKKYLVGDKLTYVDLCFVPWEMTVHNFIGENFKHVDVPNKYPHFWAWFQGMAGRPSVKKAFGL